MVGKEGRSMKTRAFKLRIILAVIGALFLSPNLGVADFPDKPIQVLVRLARGFPE